MKTIVRPKPLPPDRLVKSSLRDHFSATSISRVGRPAIPAEKSRLARGGSVAIYRAGRRGAHARALNNYRESRRTRSNSPCARGCNPRPTYLQAFIVFPVARDGANALGSPPLAQTHPVKHAPPRGGITFVGLARSGEKPDVKTAVPESNLHRVTQAARNCDCTSTV